jgi:putative acetyltransferase
MHARPKALYAGVMHIALESPDQPEVRALIAALDAYQDTLYPPESRHALAIDALMAPEVDFWVARDEGGQAVGCGALVHGPQWAELKRMYVAPGHRGRGLAQALMAALHQRAVERGSHWLVLETGPFQPEALALYERCGYARRGPFGPYRDDPMSVFMERHLPAAEAPG